MAYANHFDYGIPLEGMGYFLKQVPIQYLNVYSGSTSISGKIWFYSLFLISILFLVDKPDLVLVETILVADNGEKRHEFVSIEKQ